MPIHLRPAQEKILTYRRGKMAVSAVPGSGKTFTLALLAAQLLGNSHVDVEQGQQVLVVTYLNASMEMFKARIRQRLQEMGLPLVGFDVRTLHSLGLEIVRTEAGGRADDLVVLDEAQADHFLSVATNDWIDANPQVWRAFLPDEMNLQMRTRWRNITEHTAKSFIRTAKNERYRPDVIQTRLQTDVVAEDAPSQEREANAALLYMLNGIYLRYQNILLRQGALDFDDLIWRAADLLQQQPHIVEALRQRWPYVLEDEAQDSVPLQEALLAALTGHDGNWVRFGDPNQAITSSFTAAHPRFFNAFLDRPDVVAHPLPNSGRSAPRIIGAANTLLQWVVENHPVPEVRQHTFRRQKILPTEAGDAQPNPPDEPNNIRIRVYGHREMEEVPAVARLAQQYAVARPKETVAILTPTNRVGHSVAEQLDVLNVDYDNLLRGGSREREIAAAIHTLMALLANPLDTRALVDAHRALVELEHPALAIVPEAATLREREQPYLLSNFQPGTSPDLEHLHTLLRSVHRPEALLFPTAEQDLQEALPVGVANEADLGQLETYVRFLQHIFKLRPLPPDDLALAIGTALFAHENGPERTHEYDLAIAYEIAAMVRRWRDLQPRWRLPEIAAQLADLASGRRSLRAISATDIGFEPVPGRITLATQHSAKGLEWDAVFLAGIDGFWIPDDLDAPFLGTHDFLGGDPAAEAVAQLRQLMQVDDGTSTGRSATEAAHIEVISERLRLLYVGITRARRYLHLSRSRVTRYYQRDRDARPASVLGILYHYVKRAQGSPGG